MYQRISFCLLSLGILTLTSCDSGQVSSRKTINKSDYKSYRDYWFDKTLAENGAASAFADSTEHDFGLLPPGVEDSVQFEIENRGSNPLCLIAGTKTCKCTGMKILDREIAPGQTGKVEVKFKTVALATSFHHSSSVYTNDPEQREIRFTIKGRVGREASTVEDGFFFGRITPDQQEARAEVTVYTEEWNSLRVDGLSSTFGEDATFEVTPLNEEQVAALGLNRVRHASRISVTLRAPPKNGEFRGVVTLNAIGPEGTSRKLELDAQGKVLRRIRLEETEPDVLSGEDGLVNLNRVPHQTGRKVRFLLTVVDEEKKLTLKNVSVQPEFIQVELNPLNSRTPVHGIYTLDVTVPSGQPQANFNRTDSFGNLKIEFDHPRLEPLELKLNFYIL